jgi:hypothetical protein
MSEPRQAIRGLTLLGQACRVGVTRMGAMLANTKLPSWPSAAFNGAYLLGFATGLLGLGFVLIYGVCWTLRPLR